jgi:Preprotein translocase subunit SecA (ATPase, RNA helicase)
MRLFGSERIASVVDKLGMKDDEVLVSGMLSKSIENAQRKVEENNFGIRKRLLEYDDVMNYQREAVYARRRNALSGERIEIDVMNMMIDSSSILAERSEGMSYADFEEYVMAQMSIDLGFDENFYSGASVDKIAKALCENMNKVYNRRMNTLSEKLYPFIKQVFEKQGNMYQNIAIPISDGRKMMTLSVNLEKAYNTEGKEIAKALSRSIILYQIDEHWKSHLREMDDLRTSVQNAAYEQKDPLVVYKLESYNLFASMLEDLNKDVLSFLLRAFVPLREESDPRPAQAPVKRNTDMSQMRAQHNDLSTNGEQKANTPIRADKKIGRNDPCPCGSGKKYKNCHGLGL